MKYVRYSLLLLLSAIVPACGGKKTTIINQITNGGPGTTIVSPFPIAGPGASGTTGLDESGGVGGLGSDGQPRSVYVSSDGTNLQVRFARRNADGTWSPALAISTNDADFKDKVTVYVSQNNNYTHIFWLQGATNAVYRLHYAQVNNDATPALTVGDTNISTGTTTNLTVGAAFARVTTYVTVIDPVLNNIYALWIQNVTDGGSTANVPIAGAIIAGAGLFTERFALVGVANGISAKIPLLKIAASGRVHALWVNINGGSVTVVHRLRTAVNTWSIGDNLTDVGGYSDILLLDFALAPSGNAYAAWTNDAVQVRAAYRPVGDSSTFAPDVLANASGTYSKLIAVLEPGTEHFHVMAGAAGALGAGLVFTARNPGANLSAAWESETLFSAASINPGSEVDFFAWVDSTNTVTVVAQSPSVTNDLPKILSRTRPTGVGNGRYTAFVDHTAAGALPCTNLNVVTNVSGSAIVVWEQGQDHVVPLGEIFGTLYSPGGAFGGTFNVSQTPAVGSHGPIFALLTDAGPGYLSWLEAVTSGPDSHDVYFALKP